MPKQVGTGNCLTCQDNIVATKTGFCCLACTWPTPAGHPHNGVTVFDYPENLVTKSKIQRTTTSAKAPATAMLR